MFIWTYFLVLVLLFGFTPIEQQHPISCFCDKWHLCSMGQWVKWHPRGHLVLAGSDDMTAWLWNADTAACMAVFSGHSGPVTCGDFSPDGMFCFLLAPFNCLWSRSPTRLKVFVKLYNLIWSDELFCSLFW